MEYSSPIKINVVICGNMGEQTEYMWNKPDANREIQMISFLLYLKSIIS